MNTLEKDRRFYFFFQSTPIHIQTSLPGFVLHHENRSLTIFEIPRLTAASTLITSVKFGSIKLESNVQSGPVEFIMGISIALQLVIVC